MSAVRGKIFVSKVIGDWKSQIEVPAGLDSDWRADSHPLAVSAHDLSPVHTAPLLGGHRSYWIRFHPYDLT